MKLNSQVLSQMGVLTLKTGGSMWTLVSDRVEKKSLSWFPCTTFEPQAWQFIDLPLV